MNEEEILLNDKNKKRPSKLDLVNNWKAGATYDEFFQPQFLNERSIQMRTPDSKFLTGFENPLRSHIPLEERIAQRQTGGYYLGAGLGRLGTKIGIEIAKVPGFVGGAIAAPFQESGYRWDMLVNNAWIRGLNELDEHIKEEVLPVYIPRHVQEGNIFDWISHPAFWA